MTFDEAYAVVLGYEAGFSDNPDDPGGPTQDGVTQRVYDAWRTKHGEPTQPVQESTPGERAVIFQECYWRPARCSELPAGIRLIHFDTAILMGVGMAGRIVQKAATMTVVDGIIGGATLAAARAANPKLLLARYANLRLTRHIVVAIENPKQLTFLRGQLHRLGDLLKRAG